MCKYIDLHLGQCKILKESCPYVYFCNKIQGYKVLRNSPKECKISQSYEMPKGFYRISYAKRGKLYISVDGYIEIVDNPFDYVPVCVKMIKDENGKWKIQQSR